MRWCSSVRCSRLVSSRLRPRLCGRSRIANWQVRWRARAAAANCGPPRGAGGSAVRASPWAWRRRLHIGGVWRVEGSAERQTYANGAAITEETERRVAFEVSDWTQLGIRWAVNAGLDSWSDTGRSFSLGVAGEQRLSGDRLALRGRCPGVARRGADVDAWCWRRLAIGGAQRRRRVARPRRRRCRRATAPRSRSGAAPAPGRAGTCCFAPIRCCMTASSATAYSGGGSFMAERVAALGAATRQAAPRRPGGLRRCGTRGGRARGRRHARAIGRWCRAADRGAGAGIVRIDVAHGLRDGRNAWSIGWTK